ncbi:chlorophyllase [Streptomyces sp. ME02-6979.5a]|uniref:alpha/beta hydrolase family protein n=1 Tax=Streptomyces sp. ME02-6979.5a TaxID=462925 RepID=UPI0029B8AF90|nr:chlorophyllase [Streptomyces sp. ME02-6979.5a]MDX3336452.1 chlorophyllase [Streptomyces sp. ME02-6979.5a]
MSTPTPRTTDAFGPAAPVLSVAPVTLPAPDRAVDLQIRVSVPLTALTGEGRLPVILLSHGQGFSNNLSSLNGYAPLVSFWAAHGFAVIQPTHLSSTTLKLPADTPGAPMHWRSRAEDISRLIDRLDEIEAAVPGLAGRLDRDRIAVAGHSMGGHTAGLLLGARLIDPDDGTEVDLADSRIGAGVLLAGPGRGGDALVPAMAEMLPFLTTADFSRMATPTLVVNGEKDGSTHLTVRGPAWHTDPYTLSPGPKTLLTLFDAEHGLGGISGYDVAETTDESPARVAALARLSWAYLRSRLYADDTAWQAAREALASGPDAFGRIESKEG